MQRAQAGRVGRTDVQRDVIGERMQFSKAIEVILRRLLDWRGAGFTDVDSNRDGRPFAARAQPLQPPDDSVGTVIVKSERIDQRRLTGKAKDPRFGIARLRLSCDGADLDETEPECSPCR